MIKENKKLYMWLSVISVTLIIGFIWIASVKYSISNSILNLKETKNQGMESFSEFRQGFEAQLEDVKYFLKVSPTTSTIEVVTSTIKSATSTSLEE